MKKILPATALLAIAYIAFISLGLPDGLLGVAWPGIRLQFNLPLDAIGVLLVCSTSGYVTASFLSGILVRRMGVGLLLSLSCAATATALLVYAFTPSWALFALTAILGGLGAGAIDAGINTYVAQHYSNRTMQWLHASFGVGITSGPLIMTAGIALSSRWQTGYLVVGVAQLLLASLFFATRRAWKPAQAAPAPSLHESSTGDKLSPASPSPSSEATFGQTLRNLPSLASMLLFFVYTGIETGIGLWSYTILTQARGIDSTIAGFVTGTYWGMFTFGRMLAGWYAQKISLSKILAIAVCMAGAGILLVAFGGSSWVTIAGFALAGFAVAPIFPALVSDTGRRVGKRFQGYTIGMQIAAAGLGVATIPSVAGMLAKQYGLEIIPWYVVTFIALLGLLLIASHARPSQTATC